MSTIHTVTPSDPTPPTPERAPILTSPNPPIRRRAAPDDSPIASAERRLTTEANVKTVAVDFPATELLAPRSEHITSPGVCATALRMTDMAAPRADA